MVRARRRSPAGLDGRAEAGGGGGFASEASRGLGALAAGVEALERAEVSRAHGVQGTLRVYTSWLSCAMP